MNSSTLSRQFPQDGILCIQVLLHFEDQSRFSCGAGRSQPPLKRYRNPGCFPRFPSKPSARHGMERCNGWAVHAPGGPGSCLGIVG